MYRLFKVLSQLDESTNVSKHEAPGCYCIRNPVDYGRKSSSSGYAAKNQFGPLRADYPAAPPGWMRLHRTHTLEEPLSQLHTAVEHQLALHGQGRLQPQAWLKKPSFAQARIDPMRTGDVATCYEDDVTCVTGGPLSFTITLIIRRIFFVRLRRALGRDANNSRLAHVPCHVLRRPQVSQLNSLVFCQPAAFSKLRVSTHVNNQ